VKTAAAKVVFDKTEEGSPRLKCTVFPIVNSHENRSVRFGFETTENCSRLRRSKGNIMEKHKKMLIILVCGAIVHPHRQVATINCSFLSGCVVFRRVGDSNVIGQRRKGGSYGWVSDSFCQSASNRGRIIACFWHHRHLQQRPACFGSGRASMSRVTDRVALRPRVLRKEWNRVRMTFCTTKDRETPLPKCSSNKVSQWGWVMEAVVQLRPSRRRTNPVDRVFTHWKSVGCGTKVAVALPERQPDGLNLGLVPVFFWVIRKTYEGRRNASGRRQETNFLFVFDVMTQEQARQSALSDVSNGNRQLRFEK